ncbi:MAG: protein kinase [Anaerolineales bacterium]|nr:protein kinase [Anaerolineales bacterium]
MGNPVGQTIGRYRIIEHLGRGGMAEVYKAYQANLDRYVALKLMHPFLAADQDFIARFEREAKNVAALRHANIVQVYDFDVHNGTPYMVMEYIEGGTLKTHLENLARAGQTLPLAEAVHIVREVGKALAYAHKRQMIHRDVKPANVMLDTGGRVILTDFGIAKILTGPSYTVTGATIGTPAYMSPEQSLGRPGDHRSDIYALGVMLYQLTTGQLPYEADTPLAVMLKHVNEPLPLPRTVQPDLPEGMERIILKSMAKGPDDRFPSADAMLAQLDDLDTAQMIAIPPASMAAGPAAHAATVAMPTSAALAARPTEATQLGASGPSAEAAATKLSPAGATVVARPPAGTATVAAPPTAALPAARRLPVPLLAVAGVLVLLLVLGGGAFAFTGGFGLLDRATETPASTRTTAVAAVSETTPPEATATSAPSATRDNSTATPDRVSTQLASLQQTQAALQAAVASATSTSTPDLTATAAACAFDYALVDQQPPDGRTLTAGAGVNKVLTLSNSGTCAYPEGTLLVELNLPANARPFSVPVPGLAPAATAEVSFDWPGRRQPGDITRTFELRRPGDAAIGQPLTFTFKYVAAATQRPAATPVPTQPPPPPASPTPAAAGLSDIYPSAYVGCNYQGDGGMDYNCTTRLGWVGGSGRMTLYVDGQQIGAFNPGEAMYYNIISRRCFPKPYNLRLVDDGTLTQISKDFYFDPAGNGGLFPGGGCTLP